MIIDIHTHCFPDQVASGSISARAKKFGLTPATEGTINALKQSMSKAGVNLSVLQPIALKPQQTIKMNRWVASVTCDQITGFGTIHPDFSGWKQEIKWLVNQGFKGVKFHADCQNYFVDDPHMLNIYEAVLNAGLIIIFHSGVDLAFSEPFRCTPSRLKNVTGIFPGAPLIAAHMGGYRYWDEVEKHLLGRDIYLDTAYSIHELGLEKASKIIKQHGPEKILFATDFPWRDHDMDISLIKSLNLSSKEIDGILGNNASRILGFNDNARSIQSQK